MSMHDDHKGSGKTKPVWTNERTDKPRAKVGTHGTVAQCKSGDEIEVRSKEGKTYRAVVAWTYPDGGVMARFGGHTRSEGLRVLRPDLRVRFMRLRP